MFVLAADVGGTNTRLALFEDRDGAHREITSRRYPSPEYPGLTAIVGEFLGEVSDPVERAGIGVAGPVEDDVCTATNLPWRIDARVLEQETGIASVRLVNDFTAVALGIESLGTADVIELQAGPVAPEGPRVILGAGTGLGQAVVVPTPGGPVVLASEGGHVDFAPRNETELSLLQFLKQRHERVSVERVISGPGLGAIHEFVIASGLADSTPETKRALAEQDAGSVIGEAALAGADAAARRAVEIFAAAYGAEAGNLALKILPRGGLFVAGGIAPKLLSLLRAPFLQAFLDKGRMRRLMEATRVSVIVNTDVGLLGALNAARTATPQS